jgi:hypothetical protein
MSKWKSYQNKAWYVYDGSGDIYHAASYRRITNKPNSVTGKYINVIYASSGNISPTSPLSVNIQQYIADALSSGLAQPPKFKKHVKYFVYLKD